MKIRYTMLAVAGAFVLAGCSGVTTNADYDRQFDFSGKTTYAWFQQDQESTGVNDMVQRRVQGVVDASLAARGMSRASQDQADFLIAFHTGTQTQTQYNTYGYGMGGWGYGYGWGGGMNMTTTTATHYEEGTLILDMVDRATMETVWRGSVQGTIESNSEANYDKFSEGIDKMFKDFPPAPAGE